MTTEGMVGPFDDTPGVKDGNGYMPYATLLEPF
jgi:hypothetical protein